MLRKIFKIKIVTLLLSTCLLFVMTQPALALQVGPASPALSPSASDACSGLTGIDSNATAACNNASQSGSTLGSLINTVINIISLVIGAVAVIMIMVAGFRFITSAGGEGVKAAKSTLIYALIGIAVAVLGQVLVHFVINRAANNTQPPKKTGSLVIKSNIV